MRPWLSYISLVMAVWMVLAVVGLSGCKGEAERSTASAVDTSGQLSAEEAELIKRRDALLNSRRAMREKREALAVERARLVASGEDTSDVDKRASELAQEEKQLGDAEGELNQDLEALFDQQRALLTELGSAGDETSKVAAREAGIASREKTVAARERRLADREATLADRERKLAIRERDTCSKVPTQVIQAPPSKGGTYTKQDVDELLKKVGKAMASKGILRSDLPANAQGLESEASRAMAKRDHGRARFMATQLLTSVNSIKIDKQFIRAKITRLNTRIRGAKLSGSKLDTVEGLFRKATEDYNDAKFVRANRQLNKIYSSLGRRR